MFGSFSASRITLLSTQWRTWPRASMCSDELLLQQVLVERVAASKAAARLQPIVEIAVLAVEAGFIHRFMSRPPSSAWPSCNWSKIRSAAASYARSPVSRDRTRSSRPKTTDARERRAVLVLPGPARLDLVDDPRRATR